MPTSVRRRRLKARALVADAQALIARAAEKLAAGEPLDAQRAIRAAEQIAALDARLKRRAIAEAQEREQLAERETALAARERDVERRLDDLRHRERDLARQAAQLEEMRLSVEALYAAMYAKGAEDADAPGANT